MTPPPSTRAVLVTRLSVAQARLKALGVPEPDQMPSDPLEAARVMDTRTETADERLRLRDLIGQLSRAIDRFDRKVWGRCLACGEQINRRRLQVIPEAERCLECQRLIERTVPDDAA